MSWKDRRLASLAAEAEKAATEMRMAADLLRCKVDALPSRSRNDDQIRADLRLMADRLEAAAQSLVAEARTEVPWTTRAVAKVGIAALLSLHAFSGGAGQQLVSELLTEADVERLSEHCAAAQASLDAIIVVTTVIEQEPDDASHRAQLIDAVLRLSNYLQTAHDMARLEDLPDWLLIQGAMAFADTVQHRADESIAQQERDGIHSDVAEAYTTIRYLAGHLYGDGGVSGDELEA